MSKVEYIGQQKGNFDMNKFIYIMFMVFTLGLTACGDNGAPANKSETRKYRQPRSTMDLMNQGMKARDRTNRTLQKFKQPPKIPMNQRRY